jgi:hypothetical protein
MSRSLAKIFVASFILPFFSAFSQLSPRAIALETRSTGSDCHTCLLFVNDRLGRTNDLGNPLYTLKAYRSRTALGIHYDPSYNKRNGEDGTSGCIGLTSQDDFNQILSFVETNRPKTLIVNLQ